MNGLLFRWYMSVVCILPEVLNLKDRVHGWVSSDPFHHFFDAGQLVMLTHDLWLTWKAGKHRICLIVDSRFITLKALTSFKKRIFKGLFKNRMMTFELSLLSKLAFSWSLDPFDLVGWFRSRNRRWKIHVFQNWSKVSGNF
jgi:hypothetical protein